MSDWLARRAFGSGYAEACLAAREQGPTALCQAASGTGLQQALLLLGLFLLLAIACYWIAAKSIAGEIAAIESQRDL
jgi:hypothetical protein